MNTTNLLGLFLGGIERVECYHAVRLIWEKPARVVHIDDG